MVFGNLNERSGTGVCYNRRADIETHIVGMHSTIETISTAFQCPLLALYVGDFLVEAEGKYGSSREDKPQHIEVHSPSFSSAAMMFISATTLPVIDSCDAYMPQF